MMLQSSHGKTKECCLHCGVTTALWCGTYEPWNQGHRAERNGGVAPW